MRDFNMTVNSLLGEAFPQPGTGAILITLAAAILFSAVLWTVYRFSNTRETYKPQFGATLVALSILSTILMDLIQSNLALSLGMLGSLSIVRFRTNIRDPRDIGFIFWSMSIGLASSTGCYLIGITGSVILSLFMLATRKSSRTPDEMMLVIRGSSTDLDQIHSLVEQDCSRSEVKAKNILSDSYELVYEVCIAMNESNHLIHGLFQMDGVDSVNLLAEQKAA